MHTQLPLPREGTPPESHPRVGAAQMRGVCETAVTKGQVETQDRGQLDIAYALVLVSLGMRVHLAIK